MGRSASNIALADAAQLWAKLGSDGKPPTELRRASNVLQSFSVAIDPWIERLTKRYLRGLSRGAPHYKLVIAPYGGGKTHFLMALGVRSLGEGFAVSYVPCSSEISIVNMLDIYREFVKGLQMPNNERAGLRNALQEVIKQKKAQIEAQGAPDPEAALALWISHLQREEYEEESFGRVMAEALRAENAVEVSTVGEAAIRWLRGDINTLSREEMAELRLAKLPKKEQTEFGRRMLISMIQFLKQSDAHGVVLLIDEVETLFNARGKALQRVLLAMRVLIDRESKENMEALAMLCVFAAVPDVLEQLPKYEAVAQRLAVVGASFDEGADLAPQLPLDKVQDQEAMLVSIGKRLIEVGTAATGFEFDIALQEKTSERLAQVAANRTLDVNARRLFVKTWVNLLDLQTVRGEMEYSKSELDARYQGAFSALRDIEEDVDEP